MRFRRLRSSVHINHELISISGWFLLSDQPYMMNPCKDVWPGELPLDRELGLTLY